VKPLRDIPYPSSLEAVKDLIGKYADERIANNIKRYESAINQGRGTSPKVMFFSFGHFVDFLFLSSILSDRIMCRCKEILSFTGMFRKVHLEPWYHLGARGISGNR